MTNGFYNEGLGQGGAGGRRGPKGFKFYCRWKMVGLTFAGHGSDEKRVELTQWFSVGAIFVSLPREWRVGALGKVWRHI